MYSDPDPIDDMEKLNVVKAETSLLLDYEDKKNDVLQQSFHSSLCASLSVNEPSCLCTNLVHRSPLAKDIPTDKR